MSDCLHKKEVVWSTVARDGNQLVGPRQLRHQCILCGELFPQALPHALARPDTRLVNIPLFERWFTSREEMFARQRMSSVKRREVIQSSIIDDYTAYLRTDRWRAKRRVVLERCNYVCEGCGIARATQVHHLTYTHLGDEFLWELKAVCDDCHRRCHPEKHEAA
jgi:hypothetical protein